MSLFSRSSIDMLKNQLINVVIHNVATVTAMNALGGVKGMVVYVESENTIYYHNGTIWVNMLSDTTEILPANGSPITVQNTNGTFLLDLNTDDITVEVNSNGQVQIKDGGVSTAKLANAAVTSAKVATNAIATANIQDNAVTSAKIANAAVTSAKIADGAVTSGKLASNSVTTIKVVDNAITFAKIQDIPTMTIIGNLTANTGDPSAISVINDNTLSGASSTNLATAGSVKAYIDATMSSMGNLEGGFDAEVAATFPVGSQGIAGTQKGDYWYVTKAGTVSGITLNIGDVLIANKNNASTTDPVDWIFLESNRDAATNTVLGLVKIANATEILSMSAITEDKVVTVNSLIQRTANESRTGLIEIATQAEVNTGTDDSRAVTPKKLKEYVSNAIAQSDALTYQWTSGTTIQIAHTFNTKAVGVHVYDKDGHRTLVGEVVSATTHVNLSANPAPTTSEPLTVIIQK